MEDIVSLLATSNPKLHPRQWTFDDLCYICFTDANGKFTSKKVDNPVCPFEDELDYDSNQYKTNNSLIYYDNFKNVKICYSEGVPKSTLSCKVYFTVCNDDIQLLDPKDCNSWNYSEEIELSRSLASYSPEDLKITRCNGEKCRRSISPNEHGIWCESCHGEFDSASFVSNLFKDDLHFNNIPKDNILHIETTTTDIDWKNGKEVEMILSILNKDKKQIENLEDYIKPGGTIDQQIKNYIETMTKKKEEEKMKLNKLKSLYSGDIQNIIKMIEEKKLN